MAVRASEYSVGLCRRFLAPVGLLGEHTGVVQLIKVGITYGLGLFVLVPALLHTIVEESDWQVRMKLLGSTTFALQSIAKYAALIRSTGRIADNLEHVEADWQNGGAVERKVLRKNAKVNRSLIIFVAFFQYGGNFSFHFLVPLAAIKMQKSELLDSNISSPRMTRLSLAYPIYESWMRVDTSPVYQIVFALQYMSTLALGTVALCAWSVTSTCVTHICGQLEICIMMIQRYIAGELEPDDPPFPPGLTSRRARLAHIVTRHMRALKFAKDVENVMNGVCFVEVIGCTWQICLLEYYFVTEWEDKEAVPLMTYSMLLTSFVTNIFLFCFIGELLTEKVGSIYQLADWYELPGRDARELLLIIAISRYPAKLTAGKFIDLTFVTFASVMKSAFAYLNLMRTAVL